MEAGEIVRKLEGAGVRLEVADGKVRMSPAELVPAELVEAVRANKPAVIRWLTEREIWHTADACHLLNEQGWCVVRCRELGGARVLWTLDAGTRVPPDCENLPRLTWPEVERIVDNPGLLRPMHAVKTFFPGAVAVVEVTE